MSDAIERIKRKIIETSAELVEATVTDTIIPLDEALAVIDEESAKEPQECEWFKYDYRTIAPKNHDVENPYWRIPENMDKLKYCPYCGRKIKVIE